MEMQVFQSIMGEPSQAPMQCNSPNGTGRRTMRKISRNGGHLPDLASRVPKAGAGARAKGAICKAKTWATIAQARSTARCQTRSRLLRRTGHHEASRADPTPTIGDPVPCLAEAYCANDGRSPALSSRDIQQGPACTGGIRDPQPDGPQCGDPTWWEGTSASSASNAPHLAQALDKAIR